MSGAAVQSVPSWRLIEAVNATGSHYFDTDTMRWFGSRLMGDTFQGSGGWWFVTSERDRGVRLSNGEFWAAWDGRRRYSVRRWDGSSRSVDTVGEYGAYGSRAVALSTARRLASLVVEGDDA